MRCPARLLSPGCAGIPRAVSSAVSHATSSEQQRGFELHGAHARTDNRSDVGLVQERHDNRDQRHRVPRRSQEADRARCVVPPIYVYIFMNIHLFPFMYIIYMDISQSPTVGDWARASVRTDGRTAGQANVSDFLACVLMTGTQVPTRTRTHTHTHTRAHCLSFPRNLVRIMIDFGPGPRDGKLK
jgi:hypothetical protein